MARFCASDSLVYSRKRIAQEEQGNPDTYKYISKYIAQIDEYIVKLKDYAVRQTDSSKGKSAAAAIRLIFEQFEDNSKIAVDLVKRGPYAYNQLSGALSQGIQILDYLTDVAKPYGELEFIKWVTNLKAQIKKVIVEIPTDRGEGSYMDFDMFKADNPLETEGNPPNYSSGGEPEWSGRAPNFSVTDYRK